MYFSKGIEELVYLVVNFLRVGVLDFDSEGRTVRIVAFPVLGDERCYGRAMASLQPFGQPVSLGA